MAHIHTRPGQHDHTASAFIVRTDLGEPKLMLHLHKKLGVYLQFGGHIELDETPWQAICHELVEESGYDISQLKILQPKHRIDKLDKSKMHPIAFCHNTHNIDEAHLHTDLDYLFVTEFPPKHRIQEGESDNIIYVSRDDLDKKKYSKINEDIRIIGLGIFDVFLENWERVSTDQFD